MEAIVLAGGFGTRLKHIIPNIPKSMANVHGKPFLQYVLNYLRRSGVTRVVLATGYLSQQIENYFKNEYNNMQLVYSVETSPLFTGGAIKKALALCTQENVFVLNGDTFFDVSFSAMLKDFEDNNRKLSIAVKEMQNFNRYGTVEVTNGTITSFAEKKQMQQGTINGGVYLLNKNLLNNFPNVFSFENDFMEKNVNTLQIGAFKSEGYFLDIGIPEDYAKAQKEFFYFEGAKPINKAAFFDRDGTINVNTGHLYKPEQMIIIEGIPQLIRKYNKEGCKVIVITNQAGIAKGYYTVQDMHNLHTHMNSVLQNQYGAHIDAFYFCPHHPHYTGECSCRKPKTGMLEQAIKDFNIDVSKSVLYGDKPHDIQAGEACGIKSTLLKSVEKLE
ncbi:hypothetical protein AGMMS50284_1940 [Clostridia bacterium]|nr:hypothetical protein AGMMS50284_1940 [Clostridia bacterium]